MNLYPRPKDANRQAIEETLTIYQLITRKNGKRYPLPLNIIIRNLTVKYAGNDGFNIPASGHQAKRLSAILCGRRDQAHETTEMEVRFRNHGTDRSPVG